jgi:hypothetical protein
MNVVKYMCIAAVALAGATLSSAPARADASNCSYFNGPYCELAHAVRHHGWRPPIVWATPAIPLAGPVISYPLHQPFGGYPVPYPYWGNQVGCAVTPVPRNPCGYATPYSVTAW